MASTSRRTTAMEITVGVESLTTLLAGTQRTTRTVWETAGANLARA